MPNARKARAYTFHNQAGAMKNQSYATMQRVGEGEVIDGITSANIDMLASANTSETITDFNVNFKRDIIMCKYCGQKLTQK